MNGERYLSCWRTDLGMRTGEERTGVGGVAVVDTRTVRGTGEGRVEEGRGNGR